MSKKPAAAPAKAAAAPAKAAAPANAKKDAPKEPAKVEAITATLKSEKPKPEPPKPEPMIVPLKPEKIKEKIIEKVETKQVLVEQVTNIIKNVKERKRYPKEEDYENVVSQLETQNVIRKMFRSKVKKKHLDEDGRVVDKIFDNESDGSVINIEIPLTIVQKEILPVPQKLSIDHRVHFTLKGKPRPKIIVSNTDLFNIDAVRAHKGKRDMCDYDESELEEIKNITDKKILLKKHKEKEFVTRTMILNIFDVKNMKKRNTVEDEELETTQRTKRYEDEKLVKSFKRLFKDEIDKKKFDIKEIRSLINLNMEKIRIEEEKALETSKVADKAFKISKLRENKDKLNVINLSLLKKEEMIKKINLDIVKTWKVMNEREDPNLNDSITRELGDIGIEVNSTINSKPISNEYNPDMSPRQQKWSGNKRFSISTSNNKDNLSTKAEEINQFYSNISTYSERKYSLRQDKSQEELKEYFQNKIKLFRNTIVPKKLEFDSVGGYTIDKRLRVLFERTLPEGFIRLYENCSIEYVCYQNVFKLFTDGHCTINYTNKDIKQLLSNGNIVFFFSENKSVTYEFPNDSYKIIKFPNGRTEQIFYNNQIKLVYYDGKISVVDPIYGEYEE